MVFSPSSSPSYSSFSSTPAAAQISDVVFAEKIKFCYHATSICYLDMTVCTMHALLLSPLMHYNVTPCCHPELE